MPFDNQDAKERNKNATTRKRRKIWVETANRVYKKTGNDGLAVKKANAALKAAIAQGA